MFLQCQNLTVGYKKHPIISDFSPTPLESGKVIGLLGPNGSGKSTLIKTIAGILPVLEGTITATRGEHFFRGKQLQSIIGYTPQSLPESASLTAFETVLISARRGLNTPGTPLAHSDLTPEGITAEILTQLQLEAFATKYLSELSGGQRQMVAFAQVLVGQPQIILLDEPTSALDIYHQVFLLETVREHVAHSDALAVMALHDMNLAARYCDEILLITDGALTHQGSPQNVLTPETIKDTYNVEAHILQDKHTPVISIVDINRH